MNFCTSCGARRRPEARFCTSCGQPLAVIQARPATPTEQLPLIVPVTSEPLPDFQETEAIAVPPGPPAAHDDPATRTDLVARDDVPAPEPEHEPEPDPFPVPPVEPSPPQEPAMESVTHAAPAAFAVPAQHTSPSPAAAPAAEKVGAMVGAGLAGLARGVRAVSQDVAQRQQPGSVLDVDPTSQVMAPMVSPVVDRMVSSPALDLGDQALILP